MPAPCWTAPLPELLGKFDAKGFKALAWAENGFRHMTNSKRDVKAPDDLEGLKMRTMENLGAHRRLQRPGHHHHPMAFPEVFTALQQGTVDGQENPLPVIMSAKFSQVQKHLSLTGHVYSPRIFVMNKASLTNWLQPTKQPSSKPPRWPSRPTATAWTGGRRQRRERAASPGHDRDRGRGQPSSWRSWHR